MFGCKVDIGATVTRETVPPKCQKNPQTQMAESTSSNKMISSELKLQFVQLKRIKTPIITYFMYIK
jgi:hypothetical protein